MSAVNAFWGLLGAVLIASFATAQEEFEKAPIEYSISKPSNRIERLQVRIDRGEVVLEHADGTGYLESLLRELEIPASSQTLVFSKTSLQLQRISPRTPRAIYFSDDMYIGFCQRGDVLEISAVDPMLGTVFYTLAQQKENQAPRFQRQVENCLVCHSSSRTENVPGHLVRSLLVASSGHPILSAGSRIVNHTTPIEDRWGGWYVTGKPNGWKHQGNHWAEGDQQPTQREPLGGNRASLEGLLATDRYLTPHSDVVALMLLEHQVLVHNRIAAAQFTTRQALAYNAMMNELLEEPQGRMLESTTRRIQSAGEKLLEAVLMTGEAALPEAVEGTSTFTADFLKSAKRDSLGRSLRDLDLQFRLFRYPCSYLIDSEAFRALPEPMQEYFWKRMGQVLAGEDSSRAFQHLSNEDRDAIGQILRETVPAAGSRLR
jgi:hypothetical protein